MEIFNGSYHYCRYLLDKLQIMKERHFSFNLWEDDNKGWHITMLDNHQERSPEYAVVKQAILAYVAGFAEALTFSRRRE